MQKIIRNHTIFLFIKERCCIMIYSLYADFDPNDKSIPEECVELTENSLCWAHDIDILPGSFYRYSLINDWEYAAEGVTAILCCSGDLLEVVEPGTPPKRIIYRIV